MTEAAKPVNNGDSNHVFVVLCFITCPAPRLVKGQMTLIKAHSPPSSLPSCCCPPCHCSSSLPPPAPAPSRGCPGARLWAGGIGGPHAEIDHPSNLRTASVSPGPKLRLDPLLFLCLCASSLSSSSSSCSSVAFAPLSLCCQHHWGTTLSHSSRRATGWQHLPCSPYVTKNGAPLFFRGCGLGPVRIFLSLSQKAATLRLGDLWVHI